MMAVSLSEVQQVQRRYSNEMLAQTAQRGWGTQMSRQTYKNDLCSLSQRNVVAPVNQQQSLPPSSDDYFNFEF